MTKLSLVSLTAAMLLVGLSASAWANGGRHGHGGRGYGGHGYGGHGYGGHRYGGHGYGGHGYSHGYSYGHGGTRFGFYFGAPLFWGSYPYYDDYRYRRPVYVVEPSPVYVQRQPQVSVQQPSGYWYYCPNPGGYYPYVKSCPTAWMQVVPQSPSP